MRTFNLLNTGTGTYVRTNAENANSIGNIILKRAMREEGYEWTKQGVRKYIESWLEWYLENVDSDTNYEITDMPDLIADHLIYANSTHIIDSTNNTEVSNTFRRAVMDKIYASLVNAI